MKRFVFWTTATLLACTLSVAQAAELPLGTGDVVKVSVYNNPDLGVETRVSASGFITFPLIGQVDVAGLSAAAAEKKIASLLVSGGYVKSPQVNLIVTQGQSQQVSVLGQVNRPGRYPIESGRNLLDMLALAGGVNPDGGDVVSLIHQRSGGSTKEVIDIVDMVRNGTLKQD